MRVDQSLRSIKTRIFAGFFLVLLLLGVLAGVVWHAGQHLNEALRADMVSERAASQLTSLRTALLESRLRMAAYLRTEAAAERVGDKDLAGGGATILASVTRAVVAATEGLANEDPARFDAALTATRQAKEVLAAVREAGAGSARIQRLGGVVGAALDGLQATVTAVRSAIAARNDREATLVAAATKAEAVVTELSAAIAAEQQTRRAGTQRAQAALEANALWTTGGATLFGLLLAASLGLSITRPLGRLADTMRELADGSLDVTVPGTAARHEIGAMARSVEVFKANAIERRRLEQEEAAVAARAEAEKHATMLRVAEGFEATVSGVVQGVTLGATKVETGAQSVVGAVERTGQQAEAVAAASEQAAANVQNVAGAAEELSASIAEVAGQVARAASTAQEANAATRRTDSTVRDLTQAAQRIGDVIGLIHSIATQTNLLALNATIEAARAGEAGKGFAVVASEVKNLADQTAKATDEIAAQINAMQTSTREAVTAIGGIAGIVDQMDHIATAIAAAVEQQRSATQEIARSVQEASAGTQEVSSNIAGVSATAHISGEAANDVLGVAHELSAQADTLRAAVDSFLTRVRAA